MAVVVHEVSHGWMALQLGDRTAQREGRLTLNPLRHMDLFGTVLLPLVLVSIRSPFVFGWAKPVPINPLFLRHPKRDMLWVAAVGPLSNFLLAAAAAGCLHLLGEVLAPVAAFLQVWILINVVLGTFNLIPIPPLDGSRVVLSLLPAPLARAFASLERWGIFLVLIFLASGLDDRVLWPVIRFLVTWLGVA